MEFVLHCRVTATPAASRSGWTNRPGIGFSEPAFRYRPNEDTLRTSGTLGWIVFRFNHHSRDSTDRDFLANKTETSRTGVSPPRDSSDRTVTALNPAAKTRAATISVRWFENKPNVWITLVFSFCNRNSVRFPLTIDFMTCWRPENRIRRRFLGTLPLARITEQYVRSSFFAECRTLSSSTKISNSTRTSFRKNVCQPRKRPRCLEENTRLFRFSRTG